MNACEKYKPVLNVHYVSVFIKHAFRPFSFFQFQIRDSAVKKIVRHCPLVTTLVLANCPLISDVTLAEIATNLPRIR